MARAMAKVGAMARIRTEEIAMARAMAKVGAMARIRTMK